MRDMRLPQRRRLLQRLRLAGALPVPLSFTQPAMRTALALGLAACAHASGAQVAATPTAPIRAEAANALDLSSFVRQIRESNRAIKGKQAERDIAATGIGRAGAAFQPSMALSTQRSRSRQANTSEEDLVRQQLGIYERSATDYSASLSQLLPSGAKVEAKASLSKFITNVMESQNPGAGSDYRNFYGVTLTQPLTRDFGSDVTRARVRVASLDHDIATAASRDTESSVVAEAVFAYWDLVMAQRRLDAARERQGMGERLLAQARGLSRQGRLAESDVLEVENNLARYLAATSEAQLAVHERVNRLQTLMMAPASAVAGRLVAVEALPEPAGDRVSPEQALQTAREKRDDLRMRRLTVEREDVQLAYARNQALPRLDLITGYGVNGLTSRQSDALRPQSDFPAWNIGLQLSMALGPNRQGEADVRAASLRRSDATQQLQALEAAIASDIDTAISMLSSAAERWRLLSEVARREQALLEIERRRMVAGRSDLREILLREERAISARVAVAEQQVAWAKAQVLLDAAQGTLLERFR